MPKPSSSGQLPGAGKIFLDHVGWMAPDMERAAAVFERLGFPLTPYSVHGDRDPVTGTLKPVGTANRLAMLEQGYLEILAPIDGHQTPLVQHLRNAISHHTGVHLLAFSVNDAEETAREIAAREVTLLPAVHLRRTIEGEDGQDAEVAFTVVRAAFEQFPEARVQVLTHHTPEHMWQSRYVCRDSGITGLLEAAVVTADPREAAARYSRFLGRPVTRDGSSLVVRLDRGAVRFVDARGAAERFGRISRPPMPAVGAITLTSRDLDQTRYYLLSQGLRPGAIDPSHLLIDESESLGTHIVIVAEKP